MTKTMINVISFPIILLFGYEQLFVFLKIKSIGPRPSILQTSFGFGIVPTAFLRTKKIGPFRIADKRDDQ